jgi:hypothetical protein
MSILREVGGPPMAFREGKELRREADGDEA